MFTGRGPMVGARKLRSSLTLTCALLALTVTAGCGGADKVDPTVSTSSGSGSAALEITTASGPLGTYLVDSAGRAVYMYDADPEGGSECYDSCADQWPPVPQATAGSGIEDRELTSSTRTDDTVQAVYNDHALYYFSDDTSVGQTSGQAFDLAGGGIFYLLDADGSPITTKASGTSGAPASPSGG